MSALFHTPIAAPAEVVEPSRPMPLTTMRFSRTLDERNPHTRSSTAQIVPMGDEALDAADALVVRWSLRCAAALLVIFTCEWIWP